MRGSLEGPPRVSKWNGIRPDPREKGPRTYKQDLIGHVTRTVRRVLEACEARRERLALGRIGEVVIGADNVARRRRLAALTRIVAG